MDTGNIQETWQVDAGGNIYETDFQGLTQWIYEGALLPQDLVKRGNLRWIEARKVPSLIQIFNAKEQGVPMPVLAHGDGNAEPAVQHQAQTVNFTPPATPPAVPAGYPPANAQPAAPETGPSPASPAVEVPHFCSIHTDAPARFVCGACMSPFCKACPSTGTPGEKVCPFCGAMCDPIVPPTFEPVVPDAGPVPPVFKGKFGFDDFSTAIGYPFRFKSSLFFGAVMYAVFTLGGQAASMGGIQIVAGSLIAGMLANMLVFGVLTNTVDNFAQGRIDVNFMPSFDDFSLWDDVVHPFFLSIAVYLVSFGLLIAVVVGGIWFAIGALSSQIDVAGSPNQAKIVTDPNSPIRNMPTAQRQQNLYGDGTVPDEEDLASFGKRTAAEEEEEFRQVNDLINETRKQQLEGAIGKTKETRDAESAAVVRQLLSMAVPVLILGVIGLLWGLFYLPAACCVAGYTRSFTATMNPLVGLETIKLLGADYFKLWFMGALLVVASWFVGGILAAVFAVFDLPGLGNIPAIGLGALFSFYLSVVFSVTIGFMLYKNAERLHLFRT